MSIEKEREAFERWYQEAHKIRGDWNKKRSDGEYDYASTYCSWITWLARAETKTPIQGQPCRIIEADLSTGIFTLQMNNPDFSVSAGPKYLCDAPMENKE